MPGGSALVPYQRCDWAVNGYQVQHIRKSQSDIAISTSKWIGWSIIQSIARKSRSFHVHAKKIAQWGWTRCRYDAFGLTIMMCIAIPSVHPGAIFAPMLLTVPNMRLQDVDVRSLRASGSNGVATWGTHTQHQHRHRLTNQCSTDDQQNHMQYKIWQ